MRRRLLAIAAAALTVAGGVLAAPQDARAQKTLKAVMHSDLKIIDPIWTTALITLNHGYMIYDVLFALDEGLQVKPQMVDTWTVSDDKKTWTFKLRDGLAWHDGQPVTSDDCIASLKRWGARDTMGQKLVGLVTDWKAVDAKTFSMTLKEPYGLVLESIGKPSSNVPFMMPKRIAETDPQKQIEDATGSGPFVFKRDEWKPGEKAVYLKNTAYKPRSEPASGLAGGKVVKVDRVEWLTIADAQTQVNALLNGEVDFVEAPTHDLVGLLAKDRNIEMKVLVPQGRQYAFRFNALHKPFDNPKVRQAVAYAFSQKDFLDATIGDPKWYQECKSLWPCGTPLESTRGWDDKFGNTAKAAELLKEAGYDGTPVVLMQSTDLPSLTNLAAVAKVQLEKAGFKVDMQSMDWQTLVSRRVKKDPPSAGGWHAFLTSWGSIDVLNPVSTGFLNSACEKAMFGWPCDPEMEKLRDAFARETDPAKQKAIAEAVQMRQSISPTHIHLGQYTQPTAYRKTISGVLTAASGVMWNIEKQ
jgi:peptide/nickel transport system substrate-binding protein